MENNKMYLTSTIVNAVNDALNYLKEHEIEIKKREKFIPPDLFVNDFLTARMQFPRGSGHSHAAKKLLLQHDASIIISCNNDYSYMDYLIKTIGIPQDKVFSFDSLYHSYRFKINLNLIIFDPASTIRYQVGWKKYNELKLQMMYTKPKLFVELG